MATDEDGDVIMSDPPPDTEVVAPPEDGQSAAGDEDAAVAGGEAGGAAPPEEEGPPPSERIARAEAAKEEGNALLKAGDAAAAAVKYGEGIALAEPLLSKDPGEIGEDIQRRGTAAYTALRLNCAQACLNTSDWLSAVEHAEKVLVLDKDNIKALYRRGLASAALDTEGRLEQAKADFARVATLDPANREARERLSKAKDRLKEFKQQEKERLSLALSKGLYQEQHAKVERLQALYEEEVRRRKEAGEDEISFEDFAKKAREQEEEEKKKQKEEMEKQRAAERAAEEERRRREAYELEVARRKEAGEEEISFEAWGELERAKEEELRRAKIGGVVRTDEDDLDPEERRLLQETKSKGYYHGRLGTVLSDNAPKPQQVAIEELSQQNPNGTKVGSEWNQAGTWEEKDMTAWAKERLTACLQQASASSTQVQMPSGSTATATCKVTKVKSLNGDAQIVMVRKQPKHVYHFDNVDLSFTLSFKGTDGSAGESFNGSLSIHELMDGVQLGDLQIGSRWKGSAPPESLQPLASEWLDKLRDSVRAQVAAFLSEYAQKR